MELPETRVAGSIPAAADAMTIVAKEAVTVLSSVARVLSPAYALSCFRQKLAVLMAWVDNKIIFPFALNM